MIDIHWLMPKFCEAGDRALLRYGEISGEDPNTAPEYFLPSFIMNDLGNVVDQDGNQVSITLETTFSMLWKWNRGANARGCESIPADLVRLGEELGTQRVDMVLFSGPARRSKDQHDFLGLVEFKKGNLEALGPGGKTDREKLLGVLKCINTCHYGIVCGWVERKFLVDQKKRSDAVGDTWFPKTASEGNNKYVFCARVFSS